MLVKLSKADFDEFVPQAYQMVLMPAFTSYPAYYDGIKTKEDFIERASRAFIREHEEILLFYQNEEFCGWVHYYYLAEDRYLDTASLSAQKGMEQMLDEFLEYVQLKYPDAMLYLGFPEENSTALAHLQARGFVVAEQSWNMAAHLPSIKIRGSHSDAIVSIDKGNYSLFEAVHAQHDGQMYWDCQHILDDFAEWFVFVLLQGGQPAGAVYSMRDKKLSEIFGIDYAGGKYDSDVLAELLKSAIQANQADGSENLVYFCDDREKPVVCDSGFSCIGKYIMVKREVSSRSISGCCVHN